MKKSRKAKVFYTLNNAAGKQVSIDLNNYKVTCTKTGQRKSFYHKYLHNLIVEKFEGNIDLFRTTYVSRAGAPSKQERRQKQLENRINKLRAQLEELVAEKRSLDIPQLTNN
jgi:hypothetical protein